ncbi:MAG: DUF3501 family protein [Deltaproteobacteria bacterium]|nr:DUF3501 family protein [Deltaproteobacteria bacterium]
MRPVRREDLIDFVTYEERREGIRREALAEKAPRRVHVGDVLTFLFETTLTMRYQIQEMMRTERMVRETDIQHEIDTYNEVLGGPGELGATLLIEIDDAEERATKLVEWVTLPEHLYVLLADGKKVRATIDARQISSERVSAVQYLRFPVAGRVPVAIGADHPRLTVEAKLSAEQRAALERDLST